MRIFAISVLLHAVIGCLVIMVFRDNPVNLLRDMVGSVPAGMLIHLRFLWWGVAILLVYALVVNREIFVKRLANTVVAMFLCALFFAVFTMVKGTMPIILPFWADPIFAEVDRALHFGTDPWVWTHALSPWISTKVVGFVYYAAWLIPAMQLPVLIAMFDADEARFTRFALLYVFVWAGLGNLIALPFLSAGPVFYDRLYDTDRFAPLMAELDQVGITSGPIGGIIEHLWLSYESGAQIVGSGISAFPSVHVGMAAVIALYLYELNRYLLIPAIAIVATYQFLSVYQGWHYAIDGYFSIACVVLVWQFLRSFQDQKSIQNTLAVA